MQRKYGLFTAICLIVGTVVGSGVFFKAQNILQATGGNLSIGVLAWLLGGAIMILCILAFSVMAQKYEKVNGLVDYAEAAVGSKYAYYMGWFSAVIYLPAMTSVLAWVSARYTMEFITAVWPNMPLQIPAAKGGCSIGPECMALTLFYLVVSYVINTLSPKLAGKFQTSTTVIKFIPLTVMAVVGIIVGLTAKDQQLVENFKVLGAAENGGGAEALLTAVCATAFAYEGWIITTSINAELKDSKRNLPKALISGGIIIVAIYILYFLGVAGGASVDVLMTSGAPAAFVNIFGKLGNILTLFVAISCLGTLNGLMIGTTRGLYALAVRKQGPNPELFSQVDPTSNMTTNSAVIGLLVCAAWGLYFYVTTLFETFGSFTIMKGTSLEHVPFVFDSSEIPIITMYAMYLPIFISWMKKEKDESPLRRFVLPALAMVASIFVVYACVVSKKMTNLWYLVVFAIVMGIGAIYKYKTDKKSV
ncbi:MAG: APC family permease [Oscillospiraceae bacterium]|nr:APC family permease [Oscillospiraceae bacterium]